MTNSDDGYTGTNFNRPDVQKGFELVKQGLVGCWIVDEEAAAVVRHIFDLTIAGKGPTQIARILEQEKVLTISAYYAKNPKQNKHLKVSEDQYRWSDHSVIRVLENMEYTGCTCNFKTYSKSYKLKKRFPNSVEDMVIFPNTQEAIIPQAKLSGKEFRNFARTKGETQKQRDRDYSQDFSSVPIAEASFTSPQARALKEGRTTMFAPTTKVIVEKRQKTIWTRSLPHQEVR